MKGYSRITWAVLAVLAGPAMATGVYRWVDDDGRVHFGDRPPSEGAQPVTVTPRASDAPAPKAATVPDRQRMLEMYQREREQRRAEKAERARQRAEQDRACKKNAGILRSYLSGGPLYEDRPGGRHYLTAAEKDREMAVLRELLNKHCGGLPPDLQPKRGR